MKDKFGKYFIAIVPPHPLFDEVLAIKKHFWENYQSKAALNSPPHITVHMPFEWKLTAEDRLKDSLSRFSSQQNSFEIKLKGFGCFRPRVIFINVVSADELIQLQGRLRSFCKQELNLFNADHKENPFHPHLTVAFRDLRKKIFSTAWQEFESKEFEGQFPVNKICLLKHDGKKWNVDLECFLKG